MFSKQRRILRWKNTHKPSENEVKIPEPAPYGIPMEQEAWVYHMFRSVLQVLASTPQETVRAFPGKCNVIAETIFGYLSHHKAFLKIYGKHLEKRDLLKIDAIMDDLDDVRSRTDLDNGWNEALLESVPWCRAREKAKELLGMLGWDSPVAVKALF